MENNLWWGYGKSGTIIGSNLSGTNNSDQDLDSLKLNNQGVLVLGGFTFEPSSISTKYYGKPK